MISRRSWVLYATVSASALMTSSALSPARADAVTLLSPSALAQTARSPAAAASPPVNPNLQAQFALSSANLARAAQAVRDMTAAQTAARANAHLTLNNVPLSNNVPSASSWNGAVLSGLNPDTSAPGNWVNANPLQKDTG